MGLTSAKVIEDSMANGHRLTTMEVVFPRLVLAEFNTHRAFSRNSASSRAIPVVKQLHKVLEEPFIPQEFGTNQKGMQAAEPLTGKDHEEAVMWWLKARDDAVMGVIRLLTGRAFHYLQPERVLGILEREGHDFANPPEDWPNVHKQIANRLLEPFMWHTVVVTATDWSNFLNLRNHPDAQPEIRRAASEMEKALGESAADFVAEGRWHLPYVNGSEYLEHSVNDLVKASTARCARVSYLTHDGKADIEADLNLHNRLVSAGHMSPTEHPATPSENPDERIGNFQGWKQYRKMIPNEWDALG